MRYDVIVAGAGIVGVSIALHLQAAGRSVVMIDKHGKAGTGTSYGNAGLVERASVIPYGFPQSVRELLRFGLNRSASVHYDPWFLSRIAPFLFSYWWHSTPRQLANAAADLLPLIEASVREHEFFFNDEPAAARLFRRSGWIKAYSDESELQKAVSDAKLLSPYNLSWKFLDKAGLARTEPHLKNMAGAVHWLDPITASDPGAVTAAYADMFVARGGTFAAGDAATMVAENSGWEVRLSDGTRATADQAVIALGPWSTDILAAFGYRFPMQVKRGYHMHYRLAENTYLNHPVLDATSGYMLAPMTKGVRLTTGVELAARDARATPIQLSRAEKRARKILPLADRIEPEAWIGSRPVFADMRPVIGPASRHPNLWLAFGHAHHGFTMGPATGRLLAEMMTSRSPSFDPKPYSPARFRA